MNQVMISSLVLIKVLDLKTLWDIDGIILGKYYGIELVSSECSTDRSTHGKFEVLSLGA